MSQDAKIGSSYLTSPYLLAADERENQTSKNTAMFRLLRPEILERR